MIRKSYNISLLTIPMPLVAEVETSVMIAMDRLTLPLLIPPTIRANTKNVKLCESAHIMYDEAIPTWRKENL